MGEVKGLGRALFAAVLLTLDGLLNIIFGIAGVGGSSVFDHPTHYLLGNLDSWGWVSIVLGVAQLAAAGSLVGGHKFGRYFGMAAGVAAAIGAFLDMQAYPFWSLAVFAISIWIVWGLAMYSEEGRDVQPAGVRLGPDTMQPLAPPPPM